MRTIIGYKYGPYFFNKTKKGCIKAMCNVKYHDEKALLSDYDACSPGVKLSRLYENGDEIQLRPRGTKTQ